MATLIIVTAGMTWTVCVFLTLVSALNVKVFNKTTTTTKIAIQRILTLEFFGLPGGIDIELGFLQVEWLGNH